MAWAYADFVNNLSGMSVTGVTRTYTEPPRSLNTADLPAMWPQLPESENGSVTFSHTAGLRRARVELAIAVEPFQQALPSESFATSIALIDDVETALTTNAASFGIDDWSISLRLIQIARDTLYWAIIFSVEGSGV